MSLTSVLNRAIKDPRFLLERIAAHSVILPAEDFYISLFVPKSSKIINQKEIRVIGLRRSGNHAIINWITKQVSGSVVHLNNLRPEENPYQAYWKAFNGRINASERWRADELRQNSLYQGRHGYELLKQEVKGKFIPKDCLIMSYEDSSLSRVASKRSERTHDRHFGKSAERLDVLILRDPFNLIASRIRSDKFEVRGINRKGMIGLWIDYAKEYLNETNYLDQKKILVNYNAWFLDREYRQKLSKQLGLPFSDSGLDEVPGFGKGSSFDSVSLHGQAQKMGVLERWKGYANNELYRKLLRNEEVFYYSDKIFGRIPGIEILKQA